MSSHHWEPKHNGLRLNYCTATINLRLLLQMTKLIMDCNFKKKKSNIFMFETVLTKSQKYLLWIVLSATIYNFDIFLIVLQECLVYEYMY